MNQKNTDRNQEELNIIDSYVQENLNCDFEKGETEDDNIERPDSNNTDEKICSLKDQLQRLAAEFDNFKKRTAKEKERLYDVSITDAVACLLPVLDSVELALNASDSCNEKIIRDGVDMIYRQFQDALANLGVKYIKVIGEKFDPQLHEAVIHVSGEEYGDNQIIEEFRKGYIYKNGTVIRHSVVKVSN